MPAEDHACQRTLDSPFLIEEAGVWVTGMAILLAWPELSGSRVRSLYV